LSIAAALHPDVWEALDAAQRDALGEILRWLGQHSMTRVGPRGRQEVVPVEQLESVAVVRNGPVTGFRAAAGAELENPPPPPW
jgi:hypothetical protein